jgi:hypothetical protein
MGFDQIFLNSASFLNSSGSFPKRVLRNYCPEELIDAIRTYVNFYNHFRYHESLDNVTPADVYFGRKETVLERRKKAKRKTMQQRRLIYEKSKLDS